jgi:hypothetical protein
LSRIGITASFEFEDNITKKTLDSSLDSSINNREKLVKDHPYCSFCCDRLTKEHCIGCDNNEQEQFAKKMLAIMKTSAFKDFYSGNWHFLNDEEMIKEIQKLF